MYNIYIATNTNKQNLKCVFHFVLHIHKSACVKIHLLFIGTWKDLSTPNTLSVKVFGITDSGDFSFSHKLPGDQIS